MLSGGESPQLVKHSQHRSRHCRVKTHVLMIFEDAHLTDPTSLETFGRVVDRVRSLPVLLIVTFRPEFEPPWIGRPSGRLSPSIGWRIATSRP